MSGGVIVFACENTVEHERCGQWIALFRGQEFPACERCKRPASMWRVVTEQEIAANDQRFRRLVERCGIKDPTAG